MSSADLLLGWQEFSVTHLLAAAGAHAMSSDLDSDSDDSKPEHTRERNSLLLSALRLNGVHRARSMSPMRYISAGVTPPRSSTSKTPVAAKNVSSSASARGKKRMDFNQRRHFHGWVAKWFDYSSDDAQTDYSSDDAQIMLPTMHMPQASTPPGTVSDGAWIVKESSPTDSKLGSSSAVCSPLPHPAQAQYSKEAPAQSVKVATPQTGGQRSPAEDCDLMPAIVWQAQLKALLASHAQKELWIITFANMKDDHDGELKDILYSLDRQQGKCFAADPPISEEGRARAAKLGGLFKSTGGLDSIYVSPYLRSLQIGQHLSWATKRKLLVEPGLSNVPHTITSPSNTLELFMSFPSIDMRHEPISIEPAFDDSILESLPRVLDIGLEIAARVTAHQRVAIVTHTVTGAALAAGLVSGCRPSYCQQDSANLQELRKLLQTIESGHTCGAYRLCYNQETQVPVTINLLCHTQIQVTQEQRVRQALVMANDVCGLSGVGVRSQVPRTVLRGTR
jgi:broad specificity phosphatase PhoE